MSDAVIIVNPKAREGVVSERWKLLEAELVQALGGGPSRTVFTSAEDHGSGIAREALKSGARRIVVVGGDGTISEVVQGFFEDGKPLAKDAVLMVMPAGRGDDFFKSMIGKRTFSSEDAWKQGLELIRAGIPKAADVGRYEWIGAPGQRYFINIASFGYPGLVVKRVRDKSGIWGRSKAGKSAWTYLLQSAGALIEYKPLRMKIRVDGEEVFDDLLFSGFVLNGRFNAGGVCWSDEARIDDGLFHVVLAEPRSPLATVVTSGKMISGSWAGVKGIHVKTGRRVEILEVDGQRRGHPLFEIDGELPEPAEARGAAIEILPGAIQLVR